MPGSILTAVGVFGVGLLVSVTALVSWHRRGRLHRSVLAMGVGCLLLGIVLLAWARVAIT